MQKYNPKKIEKKWQKAWQSKHAYKASENRRKKKRYVLVEFPYPSGTGLHMGHARPYIAADVVARYYRANNYEVMLPMGWDAFGLPAENYAIKMGINPEISTRQNIKNAKAQLVSWGLSFDWSREINTTDPNYYKWTQWIFLQFYKAGLAYEATAPINWCPKDKTGLANEEVINGRCERCGSLVEKKYLRQWFLRITKYAQKLLDGLESLDWPEAIKVQQQNWIGKSVGAEIVFKIGLEAGDEAKTFTVFTTRPDTLFGVTYMVLAPEHPLIEALASHVKNIAEVKKYVQQALGESEAVRTNLEKDKTGVQLQGIFAINPANGEKVPVWVADYVLGGYGTGAIMAVPAHDQRDLEFAKKFNLPVKTVVAEDNRLVASGEFTGMDTEEATLKITSKFGRAKVQYKLRDWVFSRQRYWGEPIPIIHCPDCGIVPVPEKDLPVVLPKVKKYEPTGTGESPLVAVNKWVQVKCPKCKGPAKRETNTMPQWAGSSWYFLRYTDPKNKKTFAAQPKIKYWLPVDLYFGGMEHTTLHLLYSRFWNIFLYDHGFVPFSEPYKQRKPHGIILGPDGEKMSKSRGNVVSPDSIVKEYGADTLRMYQLFLGPHEQVISWSDKGIVGVRRFLDRAWSWINTLNSSGGAKNNTLRFAKKSSAKAETEINKLIKRVGEEGIAQTKFNTAVSAFMEFLNNVSGEDISKETVNKFLVVLAPFAPHIAEELWQSLGNKGLAVQQMWPKLDNSKLMANTVTFVVQVNGKFRGNLEAVPGSKQDQIENRAKEINNVKNALGTAPVRKVIFIPDRLINFVI